MTDTTLTLATSTVLDYMGVDEESLTTTASTVSTTITASNPINNHHYYYYYADSYVESLSDETLANIGTLLDEKEMSIEKSKQLVKTKQS